MQISATEAASVFPALLDYVRVGDEVVIEHGACPAAVVGPTAPAPSLYRAFAAIAQEAPDEGWVRVSYNLANNLDHCLYACEAL